jgi:hypothetical protein
MSEQNDLQRPDLRLDIVKEIGNLSRALGDIKAQDSAVAEARDAFLRLSVLVGEALDIKW